MKKTLKTRTLIGVLTMAFAGPLLAAEPISIEKDLAAAIALQGLPCGQVTGTVKQGDNDYLATCQDGNRYRVSVNAEGRVVVQKQ